jgi:demethoxyubiquinone hydroxylase (CLK1/Coq7/Cat5 family)
MPSPILALYIDLQEAAARLHGGMELVLRGRPDVAASANRERSLLEDVRALAPDLRVRPSLLTPIVSLAYFAAGATAAAAPPSIAKAVTTGVGSALEDVYIDQLRAVAAMGLTGVRPQSSTSALGCMLWEGSRHAQL